MSWHLFHKWSAWAQYEQTRAAILMPRHGPPREVERTAVRQARECLICGKCQDEWLKDGPMRRTA
jgi:hypothetical protein